MVSLRATLLHKRGELTEALELMDKAVSNAPNNSGVLMFRGLLLEEVHTTYYNSGCTYVLYIRTIRACTYMHTYV